MPKPGELIVLFGFAFWLIGELWLAIRAFQCSRFWGFALLFIPIAGLAFVVGRWKYARTPFLVNVTGMLLMLAGGFMLSGRSSVR